ncbi:MAG: carbohydrate porin [Gammaproteobacteria bacterium]|nr:carbohydrate porin [Gammaproteobacteria bacterium]
MKKQILVPSLLALFVASAAHAGATFDTPAGTLNLGADVEFDYTSETDSNLKSGGRLLLDINGEKVLANGNFAGFKLNPVWGQDGSRGADDVWIKFGVKNDWAIQTGHFEAADLSPAGQDTYIASSGTTMYRANYARGRTSADGESQVQATFTKNIGAAAGFEVTAMSADEGDAVVVRPAVNYAVDNVSMAFGLEVPVAGKGDDADWLGLGGYVSFAASDDLTLTARTAYLADDTDAANSMDSLTAGINAQYKNFFIAALYGQTDADSAASETEELQVYASYKIPMILDIKNFDIYVAAGWSEAKLNDVTQDDVVGARVRLKYVF